MAGLTLKRWRQACADLGNAARTWAGGADLGKAARTGAGGADLGKARNDA